MNQPDPVLPDTEQGSRTEPEGPAQLDPNRIFFGPDGLRPGWALLVFGLVYGLLYVLVGSPLAGFLQPPSQNTALISPPFVLTSESFGLLCILIATWIMSRIENRPFAAYGLAGRLWAERAGVGALVGFCMLTLLTLLLQQTGLLVFEGEALHGSARIAGFALEWAFAFLLVAVFEESLFRGYLQLTLARALAGLFRMLGTRAPDAVGFWVAAVLLSFGFGAVHSTNVGESPIGMLAAGVVGVVFCLSLWRSGSLWWAIGFHAAWDWAQSFLFGVYDSGTLAQGRLFLTHPQGKLLLSGGLTGPEGSVLVLPTLLVTALAVLITLPPRTERQAAEPDPQANINLA